MADGSTKNKRHIVPVDERRWLTVTLAAQYAHIGESRLIELVSNGMIAGGQDPEDRRGTWLIDRHSLDAYREGQFIIKKTVAQKAVEILRRHGL